MKSFNLKFYTLPSSSCHAEISTYKVGIRKVSSVKFPWFSDKKGSPNSTSCLGHTVIAKHTHLSLYVHTYTRTHTLTFLVVQHTTNKLNILKIAKQPVKWNGSSCSRLQTFSSWPKLFSFALRDYGFDFFVLFLTKHIAITNIKFVFIVLMVSTTLLSRSSICCAQNNEFINYIDLDPNTKSIETKYNLVRI